MGTGEGDEEMVPVTERQRLCLSIQVGVPVGGQNRSQPSAALSTDNEPPAVTPFGSLHSGFVGTPVTQQTLPPAERCLEPVTGALPDDTPLIIKWDNLSTYPAHRTAATHPLCYKSALNNGHTLLL